MYKVNETNYEILNGKPSSENIIKYEEDRIPYSKQEQEKVLTKTLQPKMNQIEKFNKRLNSSTQKNK